MDTLLGERGANEYGEMGRGERQGGILKSISDGFSSLFKEGSILTTIKESISSVFGKVVEGISDFWNDSANQTVINNFFTDMKDMFSRLIDEIILSVNESTNGLLFGDQAAAILEKRIATSGATSLTDDQKKTLAEERYEARTYEIDEALNATVEGAAEALDFAANSVNSLLGLSDTLGTADLSGMFYDWTRYDPTLDAEVPTMPINPPEQKSIGTLGTTGLKFEPKDTVAQLHRGERVLSPEETAKYNSTGNQTMSNEKLDQLNNTMMRVAGLLDSALGVQTRTMKNVKSLGFDYYRGSPA